MVAAETTRMPMIFTDGQHADNAIVFANDAFLGLTGFTRSALLGKPLKLLLGDVTDSASKFSIQGILAAGGTGTWEIPCRRADRSDFLAIVFLSPVRDKNEVVRQNFLSFIELDGHVERLLDARNEFHALYELAPVSPISCRFGAIRAASSSGRKSGNWFAASVVSNPSKAGGFVIGFSRTWR